MIFVISFTIALVLLLLLDIKRWEQRWKPKFGKKAPTPKTIFPILGHLPVMGQYGQEPHKVFDSIRRDYGDIVALKTGYYDAVLVSNLEAIREVLVTKGKIFCDRPDFYRYHMVFGGDRENALALCDWSQLQKTRRFLCSIATLPKNSSNAYKMLRSTIETEIVTFLNHLEVNGIETLTKSLTRQVSHNIFTKYLIGSRYNYGNQKLISQSYYFDFVFNDISQCGPVDFLPFIRYLGAYRGYLTNLNKISTAIREFVENDLIGPRVDQLNADPEFKVPKDISEYDSMLSVDALYKYHVDHPDELSYRIFVLAVGDLVGGSPAIANVLTRIIGHLSMNPEAQEEMYQELAAVTKQFECHSIGLDHRPYAPLTEASIFESLRLSSSPLVPHVNVQDATIGGYFIPAGTMVLFNNYYMNFSPEHYEEPEKFMPSRFLVHANNNLDSSIRWAIKKPEVFLPFSVGQRSCLGVKLTRYTTFVLLANILLKYKIEPADSIEKIKSQIAIGKLALTVDDCFNVKLIPREEE